MKAYTVSHLRDLNRLKVFKILSEGKIISKAEISQRTGISVPTVNKIIHFFAEKGLVEDLGDGEAALGRKPQMLWLNKKHFLSIGIILEGDYLKAGLITLDHETILLKRIKVQTDFHTIMTTTIYNLINDLLVESDCKLSDVIGIGIGIPGIYDVKNHIIRLAPLIGVSQSEDISELIHNLEKKYKLPVAVDNDLNMEVQGEFICKGLKENDDLIYLSVGTGIGSGVILNGKLRRGSHYMCGEVGYMTFFKDYVAASDKNGWLEGQININAICARYNVNNLNELNSANRAAAIEYVSTFLALCINNMMMSYDSRHFSVGGEMFNLLGEDLFYTIKKKVENLSIQIPNLYRASVEPGVIGAASVIAADCITKLLAE